MIVRVLVTMNLALALLAWWAWADHSERSYGEQFSIVALWFGMFAGLAVGVAATVGAYATAAVLWWLRSRSRSRSK